MRCRRTAIQSVLAVLLLAVSLPSAATATSDASAQTHRRAVIAYHRAIARERAGHLRAALRLLRSDAPLDFRLRRRAALRRTIEAIRSAHAYERLGRPLLAVAALRALGRSLDPVRDVYLLHAQRQALAAVGLPRPPPKADPPGFLARVWDGFTDVLEALLRWLLVVAAVALALGLVYLVRFVVRAVWARRDLGIAVEDLSAAADARTDASRTLSRHLSIAVTTASMGGSEDAVPEVDPAKDLDGSGLVNVRVPGDGLASISQLLDGSEQITAGPLSISTRQLVVALGTFFTRRSAYRLSGSLVHTEDRTEIAVDLRGDGRAVSWTCTKHGPDGRATAVAEVAERVVYELGEKSVSRSWQSVVVYRQARARLAAAPRTGSERARALARAGSLLERSLAHDPTNLLARYELGNVLRKLGRNEDALTQYETLERFFAARDDVAPLLRRAAAYSRAVALSKLESWERHKEALRTLDRLESDVLGDASLDASDRDHLLALTRSARAAAIVFELERLRSDRDERGRRRGRQRLMTIEAACTWIANPQRRPGVHRATFYQALAVAENARGRALYLLRSGRADSAAAVAAFDSALSYAPDLADARVNLAAALLRDGPRATGWEARAGEHLEEALRLSPHDSKALYLRGRLAQRLGDDDSAREWYGQAAQEGNPRAIFALAEMAFVDGAYDEALRQVRRWLAREPPVDFRARKLVSWTIQLLDAHRATAGWLGAGRQASKMIKRDWRSRRAEPSEWLGEAIRRIEAAG